MRRPYEEFLRSKHAKSRPSGFDPAGPVNPTLFGWQADIVRWALRLGKAAVFAGCGMGKSFMQIEWARMVHEHTGRDVLILAPLAVGSQTVGEGAKIGVPITQCRKQSDVRRGVNVTNYEMLKHFDPTHFSGVVLDESSILKAFMGQTKRLVIESFRGTPYKLACTATPAPNDHMELGNHADFLDVPGAKEMLARWFINDTMEAGAYRLKGHAEKDFWRWVASWGVSISLPSDLGYPDDGFILPPLNIIPEIVDVDLGEGAGGMLFRVADLSATGIHKEMRLTAPARAARARSIVGDGGGTQWVVWCNTDYEQDELDSVFGDSALSIRGSQANERKQALHESWLRGDRPVLICKPKAFGYGLNWQHASNMAFVGLSYSFEAMFQAIARLWRFGQKSEVNAHVILAETEAPVLKVIEAKQREHEVMKAAMVAALKETGLMAGASGVGLAPVETAREAGEGWQLLMGDNCQSIAGVESDSVGLTVSSLPFENLYIYSDSEADIGNSADSAEFFEHMGYLIPELYRVTVPGRLCVMHCKDLPLYKGRDGSAGLRDFPGEIVRAFERGGFTFHSRVTIWKDPVTEMQRTKNHGLLYKNLCQDSSCSRQGMADYLLVFRKWVDGLDRFPDPVHGSNPERFARYVGLEPPDAMAVVEGCRSGSSIGFDRPNVVPDPKTGRWPNVNPFAPGSEEYRVWSIHVWQRYASPVWFDIDQMDVLQYREARDEQDERHICPLQLDVIERAIHLWSNPGDLVLDPFGGIGSTGVVALKTGRRYLGMELKPSYCRQQVRNLIATEAELNRPDLFAAESLEVSHA